TTLVHDRCDRAREDSRGSGLALVLLALPQVLHLAVEVIALVQETPDVAEVGWEGIALAHCLVTITHDLLYVIPGIPHPLDVINRIVVDVNPRDATQRCEANLLTVPAVNVRRRIIVGDLCNLNQESPALPGARVHAGCPPRRVPIVTLHIHRPLARHADTK